MGTKTVLITGANSGIGKACVDVFHAAGWNVAATMRNTSAFDHPSLGASVRSYRLDVTDAESVAQAFADAKGDFGGLDAVINNAGYGLVGVFEAMSDEALQKQFDTNVLGLMRVTREAISHMRPQRSGTIVQISSVGGKITFPLYAPYHGTKWAVEGFSESLHYELEQFNIRVKIVEPGIIKTDFAGRSLEFVTSQDVRGYDGYLATFMKAAEGALKDAVEPSVVAKMIFAACTDGKSKMRYPVGKPAPAMITLRKLVSDSMFFSIVKKAYGLG